MKYSALDIRRYKKDGFVKLCTVTKGRLGGWLYENINEELMYMDHRSWVYTIVDGHEIKKLGETGNPLGIKIKNSDQPQNSTKCRMGRLASMGRLAKDKENTSSRGNDTDVVIRNSLVKSVNKGTVSIYVRRCNTVKTKMTLMGKDVAMKTTFHKNLEKQYLDIMLEETGSYPELNKGRM
jgi:hypothetical protein